MRGVSGYRKKAAGTMGVLVVYAIAVFMALLAPALVHAQSDEGFSLQVSPSPLIASVKPGNDTTLELQIRNTNTTSQALKMGLRSFSVDDASGQVKLGSSAPADITRLVTFESPNFTLEAGQIYTQRIHIHPDANAGFSYNFAVTIAQQNPPKAAKGKTAIAGTVAVFALVTVDRPGARREAKLQSVSVGKRSYEFLPADVSVALKNTGNVNVQPTGTVFIQRHSSDTKPLASLPLNAGGGYITPGSKRTFTTAWNDGFPHYQITKNGNVESRKLVWQGNLSKLRFGRYVAKVVAVYDDGERDVPIMAEVHFWIIPWRIILAVLLLVVLLLAGCVVLIKSLGRAVGKTSRKVRKNATNEKD